MKTILLDRTTWDLCLDVNGNIAAASEPYSILQDVATAARLFSGELWYDTRQGVPYFSTILGLAPPKQYLRSQYETAAMSVVGVMTAKCFFTDFTNRKLSGQIQITDVNNISGAVAF